MSNNGQLVNIKSPIFWRISASVFASILLIEIVLLVYSWVTERNRVLDRLDESLVTVSSMLDSENPVPQLDKLLTLNNQAARYHVIGYVLETADGNRSTGGEFNTHSLPQQLKDTSYFNSQEAVYTHTRELARADGSADRIWLRVDASWVKAYMRNYVWRILGMIFLISIFVTGACLVFLTPLLINPLQRINRMLEQGERQGIRKIDQNPADANRRDEIGSINHSLVRLRQALINAENDKLRVSERFEVFANLGADCFWEIDNRFRFTYFSGDVSRMFNLSSAEIVGLSFNEFKKKVAVSVPNANGIYDALIYNGSWEGKINSKTKEGHPLTVRVIAAPEYDRQGRILGVRGTITDISTETGLASELKYQANHDELTGLSNRWHLTCQIDSSLEKYLANGEVFSLLIMDLDRFKHVNDTGGHTAGDALLKSLANRFKNLVRSSDTVARMGGDEFAIVLSGCDIDAAMIAAEKIRKSIESFSFLWNQETFTISISIGVAQISKSIMTKEALIFAADSCCIKAKRLGKNQIQSFSQDDATLNLFKDETKWVSKIIKALEQDQFTLFRQSIVRIDQPECEEHFEILLRMQNEQGGYWTPNFFLPVAERNHLMPKIDRWVVAQSFAWLQAQNFESNIDFCMNINLSAASLADTSFREFVVQCVQENKNVANLMCMEVTETSAMLNFDQTVSLLEKLKTAGCLIALDDFGTGFSSLSHIRDLPLDYIKIDGRFIEEINHNKVDQAVVKSVADIATVLGIKTVAEFVDTEDKLQMLSQLQIDYAQGFLFSKPEKLGINISGGSSEAA